MTLSVTPRANDLLRFIEGFLATNGGIAPTRREMADGIGQNSMSGVQRLLDQLVERGALRRLPCRSRAIEIVRGPTIRLPADLHRRLGPRAAQHNETVDEYVAKALTCWLNTD